MFVPVVDKNQKPLMPTTPSRARRWMKEGKATSFWKKGVFCVRLNEEPSNIVVQPIVVGIDPGTRREGFTVKSEAHTYLNIQAEAVDWVKEIMLRRKYVRHNRRKRNTPCRARRLNRKRSINFVAPSVKARWQWKLRIIWWLKKIFPISNIIVEDIKAKPRGPTWNKTFGPLQYGKTWFYTEITKLAILDTKEGWETKELRDSLNLKKIKSKLSRKFEAHCVDSWVLANHIVGGHTKPDNKEILHIAPIKIYRRQLHVFCPSKGGIRKRYGGTMSLGIKKGSLIQHPKRGVCYSGGNYKGRLTLHCLKTGKRISDFAKPEDCRFLTYNMWKIL